ncbi:MAG: FHA domain-containing protein [Planctomycetota bacterium]
MLRIAIKDTSGERVFATERAEVLIGSREGADLRLTDPRVAPNHCILRAEGGRVRLLNLGADGGRLGEAVLNPGAEFFVGSTALRIVACAGAAPRLELAERPKGPPRPPQIKPNEAHEGDFAREVREALAKAPWYLISLVAHIAVLLLMSLVATRTVTPEVIAQLSSTLQPELPEPEITPDAPLDLSELESDVTDLGKVEFEEPTSAAVRKTPSDAEPSDLEDIVPPDMIGTAGGRRPLMLQRPLPYSKIKGGDASLNKSDLEGEQGRATEEVKRGLGDGLHQARERLSRDHIVVVDGAHDEIEKILDRYAWPYTFVTREDLLLRPFPKARILFINCSNKPPAVQAAKLGELVKRYLNRGCWVVTSDWSVEPYLTAAFPTYVQVLGAQRAQRDTTVTVAPVGDDPLIENVFGRGDHDWWLEDSSTMVRLVNDKATLLVTSEDMKRRYGSAVVAFKFAWGEGIAIHVVGHFYQEDGNLHGLVAMHRLINNVIVARVQADHKR